MINVAIVGATGAVGRELAAMLKERDFPVGKLSLLASARSAGKRLDGIEISLATPRLEFPKRSGRQAIPSEGGVRGGDLNHDGLTDLVIFNSRRYHQSMYLAINRGVLSGTPSSE